MTRTTRNLQHAIAVVVIGTLGTAGVLVGDATAAHATLATCPTSCVAIGDAAIVEGDTGIRTMTFPVTLSQPATAAVTVRYRIQNLTATGAVAAAAGVDYLDKGGAPSSLTFAVGPSGLTPIIKNVTVKVAGDTQLEGNETFRVTLSALSGPARLRRPAAFGTIIDDDTGTGIRAGVGDASVAEGDSGKTRSLVFPVTLSSPSSAAISLHYVVVPGSATFSTTPAGGGDFGGKLSGTVSFPITTTGLTALQKTVTLPVWADTSTESDDAVTVTLSAASLPAGVTIGRTTGTGTIVDDDAAGTTVAVPNSMAALGDSISRAFDACASFGECLAEVWSTGTDPGVDSHYSRILAINPAIAGNNHNDAVSGAVMANLNGQAATAVSQGVEYVTIEMGGNDACKGAESQMTPAATYQIQFQQAMTTLTSGLPNARIMVASVPDLLRLWTVGKDVAAARAVWSNFGICQSMVANPLSLAQADVDRRARVQQRVIDYNTALSTVCALYPNCKFDQNAVFNSPFALNDVSSIDYFHPSFAGQTGLAVLTYAAGYDW